MRKIIYLLVLSILIFSCSSDDDSAGNLPESTANFRMKVDGTDVPLVEGINFAQIVKYGNGELMLLSVRFGATISNSLGVNSLGIYFDKHGIFHSAALNSQSDGDGGLSLNYKNYFNFPSNYFNFNLISIDETAKKIKGNFSGKLYLNEFNLDSESKDFEIDFDMEYEESTGTSGPQIVVYGVEQYCNTKLNGIDWKAFRESPYGTFTSYDPYKIEIQFPQVATANSFNLSPGNAGNYLKFSKFNTVTRVYDYYDLSGSVAFSYREFHGSSNYSFIGTYSFTAVNPNNPADIIQVTDGNFRSFQHY